MHYNDQLLVVDVLGGQCTVSSRMLLPTPPAQDALQSPPRYPGRLSRRSMPTVYARLGRGLRFCRPLWIRLTIFVADLSPRPFGGCSWF